MMKPGVLKPLGSEVARGTLKPLGKEVRAMRPVLPVSPLDKQPEKKLLEPLKK